MDEEEGTILTQRLGAGRKNSDNTFSGVLLGDWEGYVQDNHEVSKHTGVYGFDRGELSYGFMDNGIGFLGKSSRA